MQLGRQWRSPAWNGEARAPDPREGSKAFRLALTAPLWPGGNWPHLLDGALVAEAAAVDLEQRTARGGGSTLGLCQMCVCVFGRGAAYAHLPAQSPPRLLPLRESRGWQQLPGCEPAQTCGPA